MSATDRLATEFRRMWADSAPLTVCAVLMLGAFMAACAGLALDHRSITGAPAWLKPAKFAISTAIYSGTLAWLFRYLPVWRPFVRMMGWIVAIVFVLEIAIIDLQAARGVTSHFNVGTRLDGALFSIMGSAIGILWLASAGVLVALFRQRFTDRAWGWWLRIGMLITVVGAALGGLMLKPSPEQLAAPRPTATGAHTVGAADGGPGLPVVGWSTQHGDLRVAHFVGMHGMQLLPFLGWLALRRRRNGIGLPFAAGASYIALIAILAWQALRGQSIVAPDGATLTALAVWLGVTVVAVLSVFTLQRRVEYAR